MSKVKLILEFEGDTLFNCEEQVTNFAADRLKSRIMAQPQGAVNAQTLPPGLSFKVNKAIDKAEAEKDKPL